MGAEAKALHGLQSQDDADDYDDMIRNYGGKMEQDRITDYER